MNYAAGGSPLMARTNGAIYNVIFLALGIIAVVVLIYLVVKKIQALHQTPDWLENEKNRLTKQSDIKIIATKHDFSKDEQSLLWEICRSCQCRNIAYLYKNNDEVTELFRAYYLKMKERGLNDNLLFRFYTLRGKLEQARATESKLSSSMQILEGTTVFYISPILEQMPFTLVKNQKNFLMFEIPEFFAKNEHKPHELQKIRFTFKSTSGMTYHFISRVIRYENKENKWYLYTGHNTNLETQAQRKFQREFVNDKCTFSAVTMEKVKKEIVYTPSPKKFPAMLKNISAGGCCIQTNLPIKEGQLLCVDFPTLGINELTVGQIRHTRKTGEKSYLLHIQFIKIDNSVMNKIYGFVYKFEL